MKRQIFFSIFLLMAAQTAAAVPREHAKCEITKKINDPQNSAGYRMSEDCSTAFVLPPLLGQIRVGELITPDSKDTCRAIMGAVQTYSAQSKDLQATAAEIIRLNAAIISDRKACENVHAQQKAVQGRADKLSADLAAAQTDLESKKQFKAKCEADSDARGCDSIDDKIESQQGRIEGLNEKIADNAEKLNEVDERAGNCESRYPLSAASNPGQAKMDELAKKIDDLAKKVTAERKRLSGMPGGDASLVFMSTHTDLVKAYKQANEGINVTFEPIQIKNATIHFEQVNKGAAAGLSSVARFKIFGMKKVQNVDIPATDGVEIADTQNADILFGGAVGAQISLNLYAACSMRQAFNDLSSLPARRKIADLVRPTVNFQYELQATKDIKINYNETYLYQLIKENSTRGGLFWTSSSQSITEKTVANKWLTIVSSSEDSDMQWENAEKMLFDLRREVLDAALGRVALKTYAAPSDAIADGGTPPENGASVAAKNLRQFPNIYCQVAAMALDIGNALFGGSSSTGTTTKTVNKSDIQNLVINGMVKFGGTQSFEAAGE